MFPALFIYLPRPLKDCFYGIVPRNRCRLFGKRDACRVPSPEEMERFLLWAFFDKFPGICILKRRRIFVSDAFT